MAGEHQGVPAQPLVASVCLEVARGGRATRSSGSPGRRPPAVFGGKVAQVHVARAASRHIVGGAVTSSDDEDGNQGGGVSSSELYSGQKW
jgi:hypothetical protein